MEIWKPCPLDTRYKVSTLGRVRRKKILKPVKSTDGYITNWVGGRMRNTHRLVLLTFCPNPDSHRLHAEHLNGVREDNRLENLRWATPKENSDRKKEHGTVPLGSQWPQAKLTEADVFEIRKAHSEGFTQYALADLFGVSRRNIGDIVNRVGWKHI